jgi:hypothetical protein
MTRNILYVLPFLLSACQAPPPASGGEQPFFDLDTFFEEEVQNNIHRNAVEKTITLNGETQRQKIGDWDAERDLDGFRALNINRPAWRDQYHIDSILDAEGRLQELRYAAQDSSLRIRGVAVEWEEDRVSEVRVEKYIRNRIVFFHQKLVYRPEEGYRLWRAQKVPLTKRSELEVSVTY